MLMIFPRYGNELQGSDFLIAAKKSYLSQSTMPKYCEKASKCAPRMAPWGGSNLGFTFFWYNGRIFTLLSVAQKTEGGRGGGNSRPRVPKINFGAPERGNEKNLLPDG